MRLFKRRNEVGYIAHNFFNVLAIVLIWRGMWYIMDWIDLTFFSGDHSATVLIGIVAGFAILYLPDKNLDELEKL